MYRNIYPENPRVNYWNKKNVHLSVIGRSKALEKWQHLRIRYRNQFEWFKRIIGISIILASTVLMIITEQRAVQSSQSYYEGLRLIHLVSNPHEILPENEGKLVHVSGYLDIPQMLEDYPYGVSVYAVRLKRRVQMCQWDEEKIPNLDDFGQPDYEYKKSWRDKLIDSKAFAHPEKHENPTHMPVKSEVRVNKMVRLGAFKLGKELKEKFGDFIQFTSGERPESPNIKMHMGLYYHANDIWNPSVGDLRIQFSFAGQAESFISVIARQSGRTLSPYRLKSGQSILYLHEGNKNHYDIFTKEHSSRRLHTWLFRTTSWICTVVGTCLAAKALTLMNRKNSVIKNLIHLDPLKLGLMTTCFLSFMTMGFVWFPYTPFFGCLLITLASCVFFYYAVFPPDHGKTRNIIMYANTSTSNSSASNEISKIATNNHNCMKSTFSSHVEIFKPNYRRPT